MSMPKKLARRLLRENRKLGRSWRVIARDDYQDKVAPGTLNRFAKSKGEWLPKNKDILIALGLKKQRAIKPVMKDWLDETEAAILAAFENRCPMPPPQYDQRMMKAFLKACKSRVSISTTGARA